MPDPIRIRSGLAGKDWSEAGWMILAHRLVSGPDPFGQKLIQTKSDPGGFEQYDPGRLWMIGTESESGKLVAGCLCSTRTGPR